MKNAAKLNLLKISFISLFLSLFVSQNAQEISIIPQPREMKILGKNPFRVNTSTRIIINLGANENDLRNAEELNNKIYKIVGYKLTVNEAPVKESNNLILIGEPDHNSVLRSALDKNNVAFNEKTPGEQGYVIYSNSDALLLAGSDLPELFMQYNLYIVF